MTRWPVKKEPKVSVNVLKRKEKFISPMLFDLLSCVAPHPNYVSIVKTIKKYLPKDQKVWSDGVGNLIVKVGQNYTTMFSCHIDMVFYSPDPPKTLDLFITDDQEHAKAGFVWGGVITEFKEGIHTYTPTTLGADDKAGIFVLLKLIQAKVPGLYIFHVGEEVGGVGSLDIVNRKPALVDNIKRAIAFDRMDYFDIINRQRGAVCCSIKFVNAFAEQLNDLIIHPNKINAKYSTAPGSFTDTANYTKLIPECTNLSVGYFDQHTQRECLDTLWLEKVLTPKLLEVDWEVLPTERSLTVSPVYNGWSKGTENPVTKYTTYADITYSTPNDRLPPWTLEKGLIKSCTETGMRRLIKKYLETALSQYTVQNSILKLLQENDKHKSNGIDDSPTAIILPSRVLDVAAKQKRIFNTLVLLTTRNFQVYRDNYSLYTKEITEYAEMLEWAWEESYRFEEATEFTLPQVCSVIQKILSEIVVINTTLLGESNPYFDTFGSNSEESPTTEVRSVIFDSVKFFKGNWFNLGYDTYLSVQNDFKQIRDKITAAA